MQRHADTFELKSRQLAKFRPTAYNVGGYLGHFIGSKYVLIAATDPSDEVGLLQQFFKVILLDPSAVRSDQIDPSILSEAIVIGDVLYTDGNGLSDALVKAISKAGVSVIVKKRAGDPTAPATRSLSRSLSDAGIRPEFIGSLNSESDGEDKAIAIIDNRSLLSNRPLAAAPAPFKVAAIMTVYNECDIIVPSLEKLLAQGVEVYLIDNWSTDGTYEAARNILGDKLIGLERFPAHGPTGYFDLHSLLSREEEVAKTLKADWFIHCDADEVRSSPWQGVSLRDAIYRVDQEGYNAINHTLIEFHPIDNGFRQGEDFETYFQYFSFVAQGANLLQIKTWKNIGRPISMAANGGHRINFDGRRIYPYRFLLKHYPIRSQQHGIRKVFYERRSRYLPAEKARGWHAHYDDLGEGHNFLADVQGLIGFDADHFYSNYLAQRLTGIGTFYGRPGKHYSDSDLRERVI